MNIEQEVREMLSSKVRYAPGMEEAPQPVLRRARTRRVMNGVGVVMAVALIVGGSVIGARSLGKTDVIEPVVPGPGKVVPWAPLAPADATTFRACRAADISFVADPGGAPFFVVTAKSDQVRCQIDRGIGMRLFGVDGNRLTVPVSVDPAFTRAIVTDPEISPLLHFRWTNECPPTSGPIRYELMLPHGGGSLTSTATRLGESTLQNPAECDALRSNVTMTFVEAGAQYGTPPYLNPIDNLTVEMINVPASLQAGRVLRYEVRLSNKTGRAISLIDCPSFEQRLIVGDRIERRSNRLNCDAAPAVITPDTAVTFAMEFEVPGNVGPTPNLALPTQTPPLAQGFLVWRFLDSPADGAGGSVGIAPIS